ncbi:MAG: hypothetical protein HY616_12460 [Candidatus Rokubacteria bacterium]|nr:hypothetical protein [Candidatus Rokubacteria bacterium]
MHTNCECGMTIERPATRIARCHECGTVCCRSCAIEMDAHTYCRWCATSLAPVHAA